MKIKPLIIQLIAIGLVANLTACSNMSEIQKIPAKQAVIMGANTTMSASNFAYSVAMGIDDYQIDTTDNDKDMAMVNEVMKRLGKNFSFEARGVVNNIEKQYQIIPTYRYTSKNLSGSFSLPLIYDGKQKALYADSSALDGLFNAPENVGKYSKFDMSRFPVDEKAGQLTSAFKKFNQKYYDSLDAAAFVEVPLNDADKTLQLVRKVQVKQSPKHVFDQMPMLMDDMVAIFKPAPKTADNAEINSIEHDSKPFPDKKMFDELSKMIDPASQQVTTFGFNKAGQLLQMNDVSNLILLPPQKDGGKMDKVKSIKMVSHTNSSFRDFGVAKMIDAPTAENSVDGLENLRKSWAGKRLADAISPVKADESSALETTPAPAAVAVDARSTTSFGKKKTRSHNKANHAVKDAAQSAAQAAVSAARAPLDCESRNKCKK